MSGKDVNRLSARAVEAAWKKGEPVKLQDGGSLVFQVDGVRKAKWIFRGRVNGRQQQKVWRYPETSLEQARKLRGEWAKAYRAGTNPEAVRKAEARQERKEAEARALTFRKVCEEWFQQKKDVVSKTREGIRGRLDNHILPFLGDRPFSEVKRADLAEAVLRLNKAKAWGTAKKVAGVLSQVCRWACSRGYAEFPIGEHLTDHIDKHEVKRHPALTKPEAIADGMRKIWALCEEGRMGPYSKAALMLVCYLPLRAEELVSMEWKDVDLDAGTVKPGVNPERGTTKNGTLPTFPLSRQAWELLRELWARRTSAKWVFPSRGKHLTGAGVIKNLRLAGVAKEDACLHGFRSTFRTPAAEAGMPFELAERALNHKVGTAVSRAYDRSEQIEPIRRAFQWHADALDALREGREVPAWKDYE